MSAYAQLLRNNPDFARLWLASVVSLLGDWFDTIVLAALVSQYSGGSGLAISLLLLCRFLPPLLVSPFAGVLLDRMDRKRLLILSDLTRACLVLVFLLATTPDRLWLIYLITILQFSLSALFEPGRSALTPSVVRPEDLVKANFLSNVTWSVMLAVGGALGGLVAATFGTSFALAFDAATFAVSALIIMQIKSRPVAIRPTEAGAKPRSSAGDFIDGVRYALHHPSIGATLLVKFGGNIGNVDTIMIVYATSLFVVGKNGAGSLGMLWAAFGIGALAGPLLINRFSDGSIRKMRRLIIAAYSLISVAWVILGGAPVLAVAMLALFVRAMGGSVYWTYSSVILQKSVPDHYLGRLFSLDQAGFQLGVVISTIITGAILEAVGTEHIRTIAFGTAVVSLIPLIFWSFTVAWVERHEAAGEAIRVGER